MNIKVRVQSIRLEQFSGEAQIDLGEFRAINAGPEKNYCELAMPSAYNNAQACAVLPAENAVRFLHGL